MKNITRQMLKPTPRTPYSAAPEVKTMTKHTGIRKLKNGRFRARYFAGYDKNGKRQYPAKTFDTEREARDWRSAEVLAKSPQRCYEGRSLTVEVYLTRWLETKKQTIRTISLRTYRRTILGYVIPYVGQVPLSRLAPVHIETMQARLLSKLSNNTVLLMRAIFSDALKKAVRQGLIRANPISLTDAPKKQRFNRYSLTIEEALRFLDVCDHFRYGLVLRFALSTGLRPEEVAGLKWADVELGHRGIVRVAQVAQVEQGGGWRFEKPKTPNSERVIVFPGEMVTRLQEHRKQQLERKLKLGRRWEEQDLVFTSLRGQPVQNSQLRREFKAILAEARLPERVRQYDLRHAFITFSLIAGVDAKTVSREAGHSNVAFTLHHYGSVLDEMHETASDKRESLLKERSKR